MNLPILSLQKSLDSTKVEYSQLGSSGLRDSVTILDAMSFGEPQPFAPWILDEEKSLEVLKAAYDCGTIGKAIKEFNIPHQKVVIMTKCAFHVGEDLSVVGVAFPNQMHQSKDYVNQGGLTRTGMFNAVENSLARLDTSYIDLLQIQRFDPLTPMEETMKALHDLVQSGKFVAERNGWTKFVSMQN
ncbi:aldo-keto reductase [Penicillium argentinense]|uniref:Aldo-keto reductase n=1 Tax=Penicillium argentinense TaxID=1131581 RepID=A0A9W9FEM0_9EURO|nr:aldo-keto reductase [Penicillium argentinense]KAJ5098823.1 aldo-keto reductase [Penicillium argentinense]